MLITHSRRTRRNSREMLSGETFNVWMRLTTSWGENTLLLGNTPHASRHTTHLLLRPARAVQPHVQLLADARELRLRQRPRFGPFHLSQPLQLSLPSASRRNRDGRDARRARAAKGKPSDSRSACLERQPARVAAPLGIQLHKVPRAQLRNGSHAAAHAAHTWPHCSGLS